MSTPAETWEQRAEAFCKAHTEVDQAGDMLAVERARSKRWKAAAKFWRRERERTRQSLGNAVDEFLQVSRERNEARAALMKRITRDAA